MSYWIISLPFYVGIGLTMLGMLAAGLISYAIARAIPVQEGDNTSDQVADHMRRMIGILLGLMLSTVLAFSSTQSLRIQDSIEVEAAQLGDLHHDLSRVDSKSSDLIQTLITDYISSVVQEEWPTLAKGEYSDSTTRLFLSIEDKLLDLPVKTEFERTLKARLLQDIDEISDLRQARIYSAGSGLDWYILLVVLAFSLLMISFRFYPPRKWTMAYFTAYAVLIGAVLYSTIALRYPIQAGSVSHAPFADLANLIAKSTKPNNR